jgi:hypothetical protein
MYCFSMENFSIFAGQLQRAMKLVPNWNKAKIGVPIACVSFGCDHGRLRTGMVQCTSRARELRERLVKTAIEGYEQSEA